MLENLQGDILILVIDRERVLPQPAKFPSSLHLIAIRSARSHATQAFNFKSALDDQHLDDTRAQPPYLDLLHAVDHIVFVGDQIGIDLIIGDDRFERIFHGGDCR